DRDHTGADGTGWLVFSSGTPEAPIFVVAAGQAFWTNEHEAGRSPARVALTASSRGPLIIGIDLAMRFATDAPKVQCPTELHAQYKEQHFGSASRDDVPSALTQSHSCAEFLWGKMWGA